MDSPLHRCFTGLALALAALMPTACAAPNPAPAPAAPPAPVEQTFIREFTHPRVVVHYHPRAGMQFLLEHTRYALEHNAHGLELDLHMRGADAVCNHDGPTPESPRLADVLDLIAQYEGKKPTVHGDDRQFFLVLEPKDNDPALFQQVYDILGKHLPRLSTAVRPGDAPRGITVVITGAHLAAMKAYFGDRLSALNRRCILEGRDYGQVIKNLSDGQIPFQWTAIQHPYEYGRVNALHSGADPNMPGRYNIRVWGEGAALADALATGADSINCDHEQIVPFQELLRNQPVVGTKPSLATHGKQALITWRGFGSDTLYAALGTLTKTGLSFPRRISLTAFLTEQPKAIAPAAALLPDGRLLIVYENAATSAVEYISGRFTSPDRFLTFTGGVHELHASDGVAIRGTDPAATVASDGRIVITYSTANSANIISLTGRIGADRQFNTTGEALEIGMSPR